MSEFQGDFKFGNGNISKSSRIKVFHVGFRINTEITLNTEQTPTRVLYIPTTVNLNKCDLLL